MTKEDYQSFIIIVMVDRAEKIAKVALKPIESDADASLEHVLRSAVGQVLDSSAVLDLQHTLAHARALLVRDASRDVVNVDIWMHPPWRDFVRAIAI
jgi:hypothetical protein